MLMAVYSPVLCIRMGIDRKLTDYSQITHRLLTDCLCIMCR